jgi:hypothetical protein
MLGYASVIQRQTEQRMPACATALCAAASGAALLMARDRAHSSELFF